jgi:hypothetical protein
VEPLSLDNYYTLLERLKGAPVPNPQPVIMSVEDFLRLQTPQNEDTHGKERQEKETPR